MTAPNAELAYAVLDKALAHPSSLDMDLWAFAPGQPERLGVGLADLTEPECGTTACYAGWTAALLGFRVTTGGTVLSGDGTRVVADEVREFAAEHLGITADRADDLFYVEDDEIAETVAEIFGPRPEPTS